MSNSSRPRIDALMPAEMARRAEQVGVAKAQAAARATFALAVLAGAFIALGAVFATTVAQGMQGAVPHGVGRLLVGAAFSLGLILVVVGGAELFTGNNLLVMAWCSRRITLASLLRNWAVVYVGNAVGAVGIAALVYLSGQSAGMTGAVVGIARGKLQHGFVEAVLLGVLCNLLVCLAVWMTFSARTAADKVVVVVLPVAAFVACGFEHSVANMYFVPAALLLAPADEGLGWGAFLVDNLLPVTIGNVLGGGVLVAVTYWAVYLRRSAP